MKSAVAVSSIAVSFVVIILSLSIAFGFRATIYDTLSATAGDIEVRTMGLGEGCAPIEGSAAIVRELSGIEGVASVRPVIYDGGIVRKGELVHGVVFKGIDGFCDSLENGVSMPRRLCEILKAGEGDKLLSYSVNDRVSLRNLVVTDVYDGIVLDDDKLVVMCNASFLRRIHGLEEEAATVLEIRVDPSIRRDESRVTALSNEISWRFYDMDIDTPDAYYAVTVRGAYPQLFDWLGLIDVNVNILLVLMTIVAAFNMVCALLIMLFQNISNIGVLKTLGMPVRAICGTFLLSSSRSVALSMLAGNAIGLCLCAIQKYTHAIRLDPVNYFVSYVPVDINLPVILMVDVLAFALIMLVLMIPCRFVSTIEASRSVDYL